MKKLLYSLLIFASATLFAQKNTNVKFTVTDGIIGTSLLFDQYKDLVQSKQSYKTAASLPQNLKKFGNIADNGLTEVKLKKDAGILDNMSLSFLNKSLNLPENTPVIIEGYELTDPETKIFAEIVQDSQIKDYNGKKAVFVSTSPIKK